MPTSGEILLDGESLLGLTPDKRPTTTVFQHFALFPHRSVLENVEFGLKMHGVAKERAARARAMEALEMVGLVAARRPQAQRALGRPAAARRARPCPCDGAEGAPARRAARRPRPPAPAADAGRAAQPAAPARADVHPRHAQPGGVALVADRIVVMHEGRIQQVGDPLTISTLPENEQVASLHGRQQHLPRDGRPRRRATGSRSTTGTPRLASARPGASLAVGSPAAVLGPRGRRSMGRTRARDGAQPARWVRSRSSSTSATSSSCTSLAGERLPIAKVRATASRSSGGGRASTIADLLEGGGCPTPRGVTTGEGRTSRSSSSSRSGSRRRSEEALGEKGRGEAQRGRRA